MYLLLQPDSSGLPQAHRPALRALVSAAQPSLLNRALTTEEAREVMQMARRIAAILLLEPRLDANYAAVKAAAYGWPG